MAGEDIVLGGIRIRFVVEEDRLSAFECHVAAGAQVPAPHSHDAFDEVAYGLKGTCTFTVASETIALGPGEAVHVPAGVVHGFVNDGADDTAFLAVITPGLMRPAYFTELRDALPDKEKAVEVMRRHGLTPAKPPVAA